jgi:hypothetical protein
MANPGVLFFCVPVLVLVATVAVACSTKAFASAVGLTVRIWEQDG